LKQIYQWLVEEFSGNHLKKRLNKKVGFTPAFTMVELVFVIVVLGILAAVAIPKLAASRDDAVLVKGKSQISAIRSGIVMQKSKNLLEANSIGGSYYPQSLDQNTSPTVLFNNADDGINILEYGLQNKSSDGNWNKVSSSNNVNPIVYNFNLLGGPAVFNYDKTTGQFTCESPTTLCNELTQ